jgi:putative ABC transport system substrate-binding protein
MQRREFITLLGGAVATWPLAARAQQPGVPVVGFLHAGSPEVTPSLVAGFRKGLGETGYVEGRNVAVEFRWAYNDNDRLPELASTVPATRSKLVSSPASTAQVATSPALVT